MDLSKDRQIYLLREEIEIRKMINKSFSSGRTDQLYDRLDEIMDELYDNYPIR